MGQAPPSAHSNGLSQAAGGSPTLLNVRQTPALKGAPGHNRCGKCGNAFMPDAEFCRKCGETRPPAWQGFCYCGNIFEADEVYCRKCGAPSGAMTLLVKLKTAAHERLKWSREDDPSSCEAWNVNAKLESEFAYMHSLLRNRKFVEVVVDEFRDYDHDNDGALDQSEVAEAVPKMVLKHGWKAEAELARQNHGELAQDFFRQMDRDSDARVAVDEFLVYTSYFHYLCYQPRVVAPEIFPYDGMHKKRLVEVSPEEQVVCACCTFPEAWWAGGHSSA